MGIYKMYVQGEKKSTKSANRKYESDGSKNDSKNMAFLYEACEERWYHK
jgi:hypothetical protein